MGGMALQCHFFQSETSPKSKSTLSQKVGGLLITYKLITYKLITDKLIKNILTQSRRNFMIGRDLVPFRVTCFEGPRSY